MLVGFRNCYCVQGLCPGSNTGQSMGLSCHILQMTGMPTAGLMKWLARVVSGSECTSRTATEGVLCAVLCCLAWPECPSAAQAKAASLYTAAVCQLPLPRSPYPLPSSAVLCCCCCCPCCCCCCHQVGVLPRARCRLPRGRLPRRCTQRTRLGVNNDTHIYSSGAAVRHDPIQVQVGSCTPGALHTE